MGLQAQAVHSSFDRHDQQERLARLAGLGSEVVACCLQAGDVDRAVELWEQGRSVLFSSALDMRTDFTRLNDEHPELAEEFDRLRQELEGSPDDSSVANFFGERSPPPSLLFEATFPTDPARWRRLAEQFADVVAQIRSQPGFGRFLLPPRLEELLRAAEHGPVVLINIAEIRSDALLLTAKGAQAVRLPALNPLTLQAKVAEFFSALDGLQDSSSSLFKTIHDIKTAPDRAARAAAAASGSSVSGASETPPSGPEVRTQAELYLSELRGWLWDAIAGPRSPALGDPLAG